jgi:hypothetical protein
MVDYRRVAAEDDARRAEQGVKPLTPGAARRWLRKRARFSLALHCQGKPMTVAGKPEGGPGCTCQCRIPELEGVQ